VFKNISSIKCKEPTKPPSKPPAQQHHKKSLPPLPFSFVNLNSDNNHTSSKSKPKINQTTKLIIPLVNNNNTSQSGLFSSRSQTCLATPASYTKFMSTSLSSNLSCSSGHESPGPTPTKNRPSNVDRSSSHEWDQISKIFDSLETLLNDVVDSNRRVVPGSASSSCLGGMKKKKAVVRPTYLNARNLKWKEVSDFLARIGMAKYGERFLSNGFDDLSFMVSCTGGR